MDIIFLRGLEVETVIGIYDWERTIRQTVIDLGFVDGEKLTEEELDKRLDVLAMANTDRDK